MTLAPSYRIIGLVLLYGYGEVCDTGGIDAAHHFIDR